MFAFCEVFSVRVASLPKLLSVLLFLSLLLLQSAVRAAVPSDASAKLLPDAVVDFRARGAAHALDQTTESFVGAPLEDFGALSAATRIYAQSAQSFSVTVIQTQADAGAYALLKRLTLQDNGKAQTQWTKLDGVGTLGSASTGRVIFFKGPAFVIISGKAPLDGDKGLAAFARLYAETLDKGEADIPVLVKHLPDWETAQDRVAYALSSHTLQEAAGNRPALDAVNFEGGTQAVTLTYGTSRLVVAEYSTPQLATASDAQINARLKELGGAGQPVPTAYRRVGNYSVFVFDAPDEQTAAQLIDRIKYEQVVQWLGQNPYALKRAQQQYAQTTAGVIIAVLKASGLSLLICLGAGAIFGGIIFMRRRTRQATSDAYTDAGGMVRLNIDEMTAQRDPARLLGKAEGKS